MISESKAIAKKNLKSLQKSKRRVQKGRGILFDSVPEFDIHFKYFPRWFKLVLSNIPYFNQVGLLWVESNLNLQQGPQTGILRATYGPQTWTNISKGLDLYFFIKTWGPQALSISSQHASWRHLSLISPDLQACRGFKVWT